MKERTQKIVFFLLSMLVLFLIYIWALHLNKRTDDAPKIYERDPLKGEIAQVPIIRYHLGKMFFDKKDYRRAKPLLDIKALREYKDRAISSDVGKMLSICNKKLRTR